MQTENHPTEIEGVKISAALTGAEVGDVIYDCNGDAWVRTDGGIVEIDPIDDESEMAFGDEDFHVAESMFGPFDVMA
jgi:hypothetical protein